MALSRIHVYFNIPSHSGAQLYLEQFVSGLIILVLNQFIVSSYLRVTGWHERLWWLGQSILLRYGYKCKQTSYMMTRVCGQCILMLFLKYH